MSHPSLAGSVSSVSVAGMTINSGIMTLTSSGSTITINKDGTMFVGLDPAQEKSTMPSLEEIAANLDEMAADLDNPELSSLSEQVATHYFALENAQEEIARLRQELDRANRNSAGTHDMGTYTDWAREDRDRMKRELTMQARASAYAPAVMSNNKPYLGSIV